MTSFFIMALLLNITPGPALFYLASQTMKHGVFAGFMTIIGIELATLCYLSAVLLGIGFVITKSDVVFLFLQMLGAVIFITYGIISLRRNGEQLSFSQGLTVIKYKQCYKGLCINLFNPKMLIFYVALLPTLLNKELNNIPQQIIFYGGSFALIGALIHIMLVGIVNLGRQKWLIQSNKSFTVLFWMQIATSIVFIIFGLSIFSMVIMRLF